MKYLAAIAMLALAVWYLTGIATWTPDDAFIAYRYAEHLAQGHGLVWNAGEAPVEPLWIE